jgi:serine/threonine protein kinase
MSEGTLSNPGSVPLSVEKRVEEACDRFGAAWRAGQQPAIEDYLAGAAESVRAALLRALLALEIELRCQRGDRPAPAEYVPRFGGDEELIRAVFAQARTVKYDDAVAGEPSTTDGTLSDGSPGGGQGGQPPAESPAALPERIGRYRVCRELGAGTFGKVYLADDEVMDRQVAIKVPSRWLLDSQAARDQFLAEARSVARLRHEGIVRAHDFGQEADGTCYIVYEFIDGVSLKKRIEPESIAAQPLTLQAAARIVAQVAEALHHAHLQGLVHRDIKPANILLDQTGRPYLADFGLAVREEDLPGQRGHLAGTRPYMSPEQVRRLGHHLDGRTDIYSLAVVLYELLCGRRPFEAATAEELDDQILHRPAKPPRQIKDSIPPGLERVCLRALCKRVDDRYPTAGDMAAEIVQAIAPGKRERSPTTVISPQEVERRMASADDNELRRLLRLMQHAADPVYVPHIFRCLGNPSEAVRQQARKAIHALGWEKVSQTAEDLARRGDGDGIAAVLDGLVAFEAHPQTVALLDRLIVLLKGDLRNRAILLLERKRLGLELDAVGGLFREIHSPYRIEKAMGQGLFASAYLARADGTDLAVVVRVLRPEFVGQPQLRAQLLDLSSRALQLVHENLVLTREVRAFPERNVYFTVRDYVDGVTLQRLLEGGKRFEPDQILRLLRHLAAALGVVHRRGMCHGGVKPSNVFVCADDRIVLGDPSLPVQGIGVALERLCYDYRYAAPETYAGGAEVAVQADFYSLGCLAYELACGQPPFAADSYVELAARHLHEAVMPPSQRGSRLDPAYDPFLLKLLARSPTDRFARAEDVLLALSGLEPSQAGLVPLRRAAAPLLRDASLARLRGAESVMGFDASAASLMSGPAETMAPESAPPPQAPEPPSRIGNYDILEVVGSGGMGIVYKARDPRLDRVVALKVLRSELASFSAVPAEELRRFRSEAQAVARLQHPHIVQIYDVGEHEGLSYVALEFVGGGSLAQRLRSERPAPRAAAQLAVQLARAIHHAHVHGVIHRDLKPSNVLLTPDGQPKVADFGLAKLQETPGEDATKTYSGMIVGTPSYIAPEQAAGRSRDIGPATDVYGLGGILYESLTGRPPFRGESAFATLSLLATGQVVSPDSLNPAVPCDLSAICLKCLEKDPQRRYPSAMALAADLERWLAGEPIHARPASKITRIVRWCRWSLASLLRRRV